MTEEMTAFERAQIELANRRLEWEAAEGQEKRNLVALRVQYEASTAYSIQSYKALMIISGAAAISLLAFMGHVAGNETESRMVELTKLVPPLYKFGIAAFLAAFATAVSSYGVTILGELQYLDHPRHKSAHRIIAVLETIVLLAGWALFLWGLYQAGNAFEGLRIVEN